MRIDSSQRTLGCKYRCMKVEIILTTMGLRKIIFLREAWFFS